MVMTLHPKTESERKCRTEKMMMDQLRLWHKKRLIDEREAERAILVKSREVEKPT